MILAQEEYVTHPKVLPSEGKNILIVDDDKMILRLLSHALGKRMNGCTVLAAENGKEAVDILKAHQIALVLTDLKMPEMDGYQLLAYVREKYRFIPVCVMTADDSPDVGTRLRSLGAAFCIGKPFEVQDLLNEISDTLAVSQKNSNTQPARQYSV